MTHPAREQNLPRSWIRTSDGEVRRNVPIRDIAAALEDPKTMVWVDVDSTNRHQFAVLEKVFKFHHLAIEDTLNPNSRVKLDEYEGYIFVIVRGVEFDPNTPDPLDLTTFNLCCFLGKNFLVTTHSQLIPSIEYFDGRCELTPDVLARGAARAMYTVLDTAVDAYFPILDKINDFVDGLEEQVFTRYQPEVLGEVFSVKRAVLSLRRHLIPQRDVFGALANRPSTLMSVEEQRYFRDVYDHVLRITDSLEQFRDLLSSVMDASLTQTSNRLGQVTKGLSVVATVSIPFVVISGMWGMNFTDIPLSHWPHGFWVMMALQLVIGLGLLAYLYRKNWL